MKQVSPLNDKSLGLEPRQYCFHSLVG